MYSEIIQVENKKINLGIEILRVILCFWVLCFHCLKKNKLIISYFSLLKLNFFMVLVFVLYHFIFQIIFFSQELLLNLKKDSNDY